MRKLIALISLLFLSAAGLIGGPTWLAHSLAGDADPRWSVADPAFEVAGFAFYTVADVERFGSPLQRSPGLAAAGFGLTFGGPLAGFGVLMLSQLYSEPKPREVGREKWMTPRQAQKAGLAVGRGVVVGQFNGTFGGQFRRRLLTFDGPEHQIVTGASRSGKGVGHVIPTLLTWHRSALVYDVKAELWEATSGWRSRFSHCVRFNPTDASSARYNPLLEVRRGPCEIRDAQNVAEMLVDDGSGRPRSEPWDSETAQLLTATVLHVLYAEPDGQKNLGRVRDLILDLDKTLVRMLETRHVAGADGEPTCHPEVKAVAQHMKTQAPKFRDSVRGTASARLVLWADPIVREVTSASDFASGDLMCLTSPMTLYVQPPPADAARVRPLTRLMLHQMTRALMEHLDKDAAGRPKKHRLLLLLDEFPTLRKMEFVSEGLRQMAGYGIKTLIVAQSFQDIEEHYGAKQTIVDNCHVLCCFAAADTGTAQRISQMSGSATELRRSYGRSSFLDATKSITYSESTRPLLLPGDVRELPYDTQLVFVTGHPPLRCKKVRHYADPLFRRRTLPPPEQKKGVVDLPARPPNPWKGVRPLAVEAADRDDERDEPSAEQVDASTGELLDGDAPLTDAQRLHLERLCPGATAESADESDREAAAQPAVPTPTRPPNAAAVAATSPPEAGDTFYEDLFS